MPPKLLYPVHLQKPDPKNRKGWVATFVDPDDRHRNVRTPAGRLRMRKLTLKEQGDSRAADRRRRDEIVRLSRKQAKRWSALQDGATVKSGTSIEAALEAFHETIHDPVTDRTHREGTNRFKTWCYKKRLYSCDDVRRGVLMEYRRNLLAEKRKKGWAGRTFDKYLGSAKTAVTYMVDEELVAHVSYDDLKRIKLLNEPTDRKDFNTRAQVRRILEAALRHDRDVFESTRWVPGRGRPVKSKHKPIAPFALFVLLSSMRPKESRTEPYEMPGKRDASTLELDFIDMQGDATGRLVVPKEIAKNKKRREIGLRETPYLKTLLQILKLLSGGKGVLFGLTQQEITNAMRRMRETYGSGYFTWYSLRRTGLTHLCCAPGIYGAASIFLTAARAGHGSDVCEDHYVGQVHGIDPTLRTLEAVLGIEDLCQEILSDVEARGSVRRFKTA